MLQKMMYLISGIFKRVQHLPPHPLRQRKSHHCQWGQMCPHCGVSQPPTKKKVPETCRILYRRCMHWILSKSVGTRKILSPFVECAFIHLFLYHHYPSLSLHFYLYIAMTSLFRLCSMRMSETAPSFLLYDQLSILLIILVIFFHSFSDFSSPFLNIHEQNCKDMPKEAISTLCSVPQNFPSLLGICLCYILSFNILMHLHDVPSSF